MKINRIASLVKASKTIITTSHNKTLWVSDGWVGWYPLFEMPDNLGEESIFALFDIAEDARGKYQFMQTLKMCVITLVRTKFIMPS